MSIFNCSLDDCLKEFTAEEILDGYDKPVSLNPKTGVELGVAKMSESLYDFSDATDVRSLNLAQSNSQSSDFPKSLWCISSVFL